MYRTFFVLSKEKFRTLKRAIVPLAGDNMGDAKKAKGGNGFGI
jgi:hypothetical protein